MLFFTYVHEVRFISDIAAKIYRIIMYERYTRVLESIYSKIKEWNIDTERTEHHKRENVRKLQKSD